MEKLLVRLAQQLDAIDEASLMSLWSKYATTASRFEPTKRWEEATLIFSLIQAKRWKNQLFNYHWSKQSQPLGKEPERVVNPMTRRARWMLCWPGCTSLAGQRPASGLPKRRKLSITE